MARGFEPVVIAVCGSPAAGKTSIAKGIASSLRLLLISRDEFAIGLQLGASDDASSDGIRVAAEESMVAVSKKLASTGVSFVLESSVLDDTHLAPLAEAGARVLVVHVAASPATIKQRLVDRIASGDLAMQRLLDQHHSGVMAPEIFAPWSDADRVVLIDTSDGRSATAHLPLVLSELDGLRP